ncbi:hypothetical protein TNCV_2594961 [Trichonephila clavipes]|nr:hypothetical protein TNCV_2594961 [Trichonephila clavipes]
MQEYLQWKRQHTHWTRDQWRTVLFTDESRFSLENDSRRIFTWRQAGTYVFIHDSSVKEMHKDQAVSVFGVVSLWVDKKTSKSFPVEILMLTFMEMTSRMLICSFILKQHVRILCYMMIMRDHTG